MRRSEEPTTAPEAAWPRSGRSLVAVIAGLLGLILLASALLSSSSAQAGGWFGHRGRWHGGGHDPELAQERARHVARFVLSYVDATDEQEQQIQAIVARSVDELQALRDEHRAHRDELLRLFQEPAIDRAAVEELRRAELSLADTASQTLAAAFADAAEVLTPEQRTELFALGDRFHRD